MGKCAVASLLYNVYFKNLLLFHFVFSDMNGFMNKQEKIEERKERFKAMSSSERKALIRQKMKAQGLEEGSGIPGRDLSSYDQGEIWDVIQITRCFPELQTKQL